MRLLTVSTDFAPAEHEGGAVPHLSGVSPLRGRDEKGRGKALNNMRGAIGCYYEGGEVGPLPVRPPAEPNSTFAQTSYMSDLTTILEKFEGSLIRRGRTFYLRRLESLEFVEGCEHVNLAVVRVEGLEYDGQTIAPDPGLILDCPAEPRGRMTWPAYRQLCNRAAREFLSDVGGGGRLLFQFVVLDEKNWASKAIAA